MKSAGNILFSGVGGQGILLAAEVTALALLAAGYDVKNSEVHGMAQRGGSVTAQLRYGKNVYAPLIEPGTTDIQVAFEMMEAVRYLPFLHPKSRVIVNTQKILPLAVATGKMAYPEKLLDHLEQHHIQVKSLDALEVAQQLGERRTANIVMVGVLSSFVPVAAEVFEAVIRKRVPEKYREVNVRAFKAGRGVVA